MYYAIYELQNLHSSRTASAIRKFNSLTHAKVWATKNQKFENTALVIEDATGKRVAYKDIYDKKWTNIYSTYPK